MFSFLALLQVDLAAGEKQLQEIEGRIRGLNASADVIRTQRCAVKLDSLLGRGSLKDSARALELAAAPVPHASCLAGTAHGPHESSHQHDAEVGTVCLRLAKPISLTRSECSVFCIGTW